MTSWSGRSRDRRPAGWFTGPTRASTSRTQVLSILSVLPSARQPCAKVVPVTAIKSSPWASIWGSRLPCSHLVAGEKARPPAEEWTPCPLSWWTNLGVATPDQWQPRSTPQPGWPETGPLCPSPAGGTGGRCWHRPVCVAWPSQHRAAAPGWAVRRRRPSAHLVTLRHRWALNEQV